MSGSDSVPRHSETSGSDDPPRDAAPTVLSERRRRSQGKLLVFAVLGLSLAIGYAWAIRAQWMRLVDPMYGDPIVEAFRRYDLDQANVPRGLFSVGNVLKDGIPSIDKPQFLSADDALLMRPADRIIGITVADQARAYPLKILDYHEVVNDNIADQPVAVTYCPLCDSGLVFDRSSPTGPVEFGVSGLLYNCNVLFYDRASGDESLWSQMKGEAVYGPRASQSLTALPYELTTWKSWTQRHPGTLVLSGKTGSGIHYNRPSPYTDYFAGEHPLPVFSVEPYAPIDHLEWLDQVLGVWSNDAAVAFPIKAFQEHTETTTIETNVGSAVLKITYDADARSLRVVESDDETQWMYGFWFAWYAFHPDSEVYGTSAAATARETSNGPSIAPATVPSL